MEDLNQLSQFIGRFHVVVLHLPIGFLVLLGALEALAFSPRYRQVNSAGRTILALTVPVTLLTAFCGWLLASGGGYNESLLWWHRWLGVGVSVAVCLLLVFHWRGWVWAYRALLLVSLVLMGIAGHLGGSLTHGSSFLTQLAPWHSLRESNSDPQPAAVDYPTVSVVLERNCISCHGPDKSKAGLRLDTRESILAGGDNGPVVVPGQADASPLIKRVTLPLEDDDHMPPEGKPQPSPQDIELLRQWIDAGATE